MPIPWIYNFSSTWTWEFNMNVNLGAIIVYSEYPEYWLSCSIQRYKINLPSSPFDCRIKIKYSSSLLPRRLALKEWDQIFLGNVFLKLWLVNWKICQISCQTKIFLIPRQVNGVCFVEEIGVIFYWQFFIMLNDWKSYWLTFNNTLSLHFESVQTNQMSKSEQSYYLHWPEEVFRSIKANR